MAGESLDFIESPNKVKVHRAWTNQATAAAVATAAVAAATRLRAETQQPRVLANAVTPKEPKVQSPKRQQPIAPSSTPIVTPAEDRWFVRYTDGRGVTIVHRMTTDEVLCGIETKYLDVNAAGKSGVKDDFRPLREFEPFRKPMDKRLSKCKVIRPPSGTKSSVETQGVWIALAASLAAAAFAVWKNL